MDMQSASIARRIGSAHNLRMHRRKLQLGLYLLDFLIFRDRGEPAPSS